VQAPNSWSPPSGTLGAIVEQTTHRVAALRAMRRELESGLAGAPSVAPFAAALRGPMVRVIAEVKRRSPSKGTINAAMDAPAQAAAYEMGGAAVVSVLTESTHFGGSNDDLLAVRVRVKLPVLKKDFHVDAIQLTEARVLGASAALLIARAIDPAALPDLVAHANAIRLETLVEIRSQAELANALAAGARVIGVNCRDLENLAMDASVAERLIAEIPADVIGVWESAISSMADVQRAASFGADAVLVGSAVSAAEDPSAAVRALSAVPRVEGIRD